MLIEGMARPDEVAAFYHRMRDSLGAPLTVAGVSVRIAASIGVVLDPDPVDAHRLEACENVADHLAAASSPPSPVSKRPANPLKTTPADHAAGLKAARAVLEESTE